MDLSFILLMSSRVYVVTWLRESGEHPLESELVMAITRLFAHLSNVDLLGTHSMTHMETVMEA